MKQRKVQPRQPIYVLDTHSLYWYLQNPTRLSPAADAVFRLVETGGARVIIPAIVVAEIYYLTMKHGKALRPSKLLKDVEEIPGYYLSELGRAQLEKIEVLDIDEMHDRLIAADALAHQAIVVTKDSALKESEFVSTLW